MSLDFLQKTKRHDDPYFIQETLFVRSGYVYLDYGFMMAAGINGYDWSSFATNKVWTNPGLGALILFFYPTGLYLSNGPDPRHVGFPVRCLASGA